MNKHNPEDAPVESTPPPMPYKDRSVGLTLFGVLTILLGCLAGLFVLLMVGQAATAGGTNPPSVSSLATTHVTQAPPVSFRTIVPVVSIYGGLAVALVWLGIGSIMARRWARALLLIFSWSWLVMGLLVLISMVFLMPRMLRNLPTNGTTDHPAFMNIVMVAVFLVFGVIFVIMPGVWTFFYSSWHVKATCQTRDPKIRWTDACPLPVLGLCVWLAFSVPMMLIMPIAGRGVMPFFGMFLTGVPGTLFMFTIAALWGYAALSLYKLEQRGWWLILIAMCVFMLSGLLTFARHDMMEMYHLMGYPEAQIEQIQKSGLMVGNTMTWLMVFSMMPFLIYLFFIRKYLRR